MKLCIEFDVNNVDELVKQIKSFLASLGGSSEKISMNNGVKTSTNIKTDTDTIEKSKVQSLAVSKLKKDSSLKAKIQEKLANLECKKVADLKHDQLKPFYDFLNTL